MNKTAKFQQSIRKALEYYTTDSIHELRYKKKGYSACIGGYYNDLDILSGHAAQATINGAEAVWVTLNKLPDELLCRAQNKANLKGSLTKDKEVVAYRWLIVDLDPVRLGGISSTKTELELAKHKAIEIRDRMMGDGWPEPGLVMSGNGYQLSWRINLENTKENSILVKNTLSKFDVLFSDPELVVVDKSVYNAARVWKLPGTVARKGDNHPDRPHRVSKLVSIPEKKIIVKESQLKKFAGVTKKHIARQSDQFDAGYFLEQHVSQLDGPKTDGGSCIWQFQCPFVPDHGGRSAWAIEHSDGKLIAGCNGNRCKDKWGWKELRSHFDQDYVAGIERRERVDRILSTCTPQQITKQQIDLPWEDLLKKITVKDKITGQNKELVVNNLYNANIVIQYHPEIMGILRLNEFTGQIEKSRKLPAPDWYGACSDTLVLTEHDRSTVLVWAQDLNYNFRPEDLNSAIDTVAFANKYHPVKGWIEGLKWDRESRIDQWLQNSFGAEDSPYLRLVGKWWMIGAVARMMLSDNQKIGDLTRKSVKMDNLLVLEGKQGIGKSMALCALCADDRWFLQHRGTLAGKEFMIGIKHKWIVELDELDFFNETTTQAIKSVLSASVDSYRGLYAKELVDQVRRVILAATTNEKHYLKDATGNRRFWPVHCNEVDLEYIRENREQLFAEALFRLKSGQAWYPQTKEENELCEAEQALRIDDSVWDHKIKTYLDIREVKGNVAPRFLLEDILDLQLTDPNRDNAKYKELSECMARLGHKKTAHKVTPHYPHNSARARCYCIA